MHIILVPKHHGKKAHVSFSAKQSVALILLFVFLLPLFAGFGTYYGVQYYRSNAEQPLVRSDLIPLENQLARKSEKIKQIRTDANHHLDALGLRVGRLQAQVTRINAFGKRLSELAGLQQGEFQFDQEPAVGGPRPMEIAEERDYDHLLDSLRMLEVELSNYSDQLALMEALMTDRDLEKAQRPNGKPVIKGWISSGYGYRRDPFTGRRAFHSGIDVAAKEGSPVQVVADGIVTRVQVQSGYGLLVEVNHGNGYHTRYAHALSALVSPGEKVTKGQAVAVVGSTGRSTGPHTHFEVLFKGKNVNPFRYLRASRK